MRPSAVALLSLLVAMLLLGGCDDGAAKQAQRRSTAPVPVAVKTLKPHAVDIYASYPGRIRGARQVQVQARVAGILRRRHYNQGEFVDKGTLLFTIDPSVYQARVQQRQAQLEKAQANLDQARQVWDRVSRLYQVNAVSEARRDEAYAKLQTAQAAVEVAQANLKAAQIQLDFTTVEAPLAGVTRLQAVDVGAFVTQGTVLTTITQVDPVHVQFAVPAEDALMGNKPLLAMVRSGKAQGSRDVTLILPSGEAYAQEGFIDYTQSTIDPATGTVRLRAVFDNADRELVPGRFVSVRLRLDTRGNAIVIPAKAIATSQLRTRVFIVGEQGKARPVPVKLGPAVAGGRIVEQGLEAGDRVIVIGLAQVSPGAPVAIKPRDELALGGQPFGKGKTASTSGTPAPEKDSQGSSKQASASGQQGRSNQAPASGADQQGR